MVYETETKRAVGELNWPANLQLDSKKAVVFGLWRKKPEKTITGLIDALLQQHLCRLRRKPLHRAKSGATVFCIGTCAIA